MVSWHMLEPPPRLLEIAQLQLLDPLYTESTSGRAVSAYWLHSGLCALLTRHYARSGLIGKLCTRFSYACLVGFCLRDATPDSCLAPSSSAWQGDGYTSDSSNYNIGKGFLGVGLRVGGQNICVAASLPPCSVVPQSCQQAVLAMHHLQALGGYIGLLSQC